MGTERRRESQSHHVHRLSLVADLPVQLNGSVFAALTRNVGRVISTIVLRAHCPRRLRTRLDDPVSSAQDT